MKKYAILGPRLRVFRVIESETEPQAPRFEEITEEQAQTINEGNGAYFLVDGTLTTAQEHVRSHRWNTETESWDYVPPPIPTEVERYKFLGQLAKEVMEGDDTEMQQTLTQTGTMTNLLTAMTTQSQDIPDALKPSALNEIEEAKTFRRDHPFIDLIGPAFGYVTEEQKNEFFIRANNYKFGP